MKIVALLLLACLTIVPGLHAQTSGSRRIDSVIGLPIYTSDGVLVGQVASLAKYKGKRLMIGDVGLALGFGSRLVLIPRDLAIVQEDRIVLTITKDRVSEVLGADK
jgi:hypothetical protein